MWPGGRSCGATSPGITSSSPVEKSATRKPDGFDPIAYLIGIFSMYDGETKEVRLKCDNSLMKTVIDRVAPRYSEVSDKDFYYLLTAADSDPKMLERTLEGFRGFTEDCLTNPQERGVVYGVGLWEIGDVQKSPALKQAYEMGKGV